jgi:hypothetical protein
MLPVFSRRKFVSRFVLRGGALLTAAFSIAGCGRKKEEEKISGGAQASVEPCSDLSGVPENDIELRKKFAYVNQSPINDNQCNNCNLYLPPKKGSPCGGCMLFKGPVHPEGYCTYWAPKVE